MATRWLLGGSGWASKSHMGSPFGPSRLPKHPLETPWRHNLAVRSPCVLSAAILGYPCSRLGVAWWSLDLPQGSRRLPKEAPCESHSGARRGPRASWERKGRHRVDHGIYLLWRTSGVRSGHGIAPKRWFEVVEFPTFTLGALQAPQGCNMQPLRAPHGGRHRHGGARVPAKEAPVFH